MEAAMASNSSSADPTSTTSTTISTSKPITTTISLASTTTAASPARPTGTTTVPLSQAKRPQFFQHHHQLQPPLPLAASQQQIITGTAQATIQTQPQPQPQTQTQTTVLYPLASSGRGLLTTTRPQLLEPRVTVAKPGVYPLAARSIVAGPGYHPPPPPPPPPEAQLQPPHSSYPFRPTYLLPSHGHISSISVPAAAAAAAATGGIRGIPVCSLPHSNKVASSPCFAPDSNGHEEPIDKGTDDLFVSVKDRKVRISDGASIYALCRSWLRNGYPEESQLQYADFVKSLPKPLPMPMSESSPLKRKEGEDETEIEQDEESIENLSAKDLLQRHIKRSKRVRARLREERLQRIARYKSRLALLLPPVMEQCGNDTSTGS